MDQTDKSTARSARMDASDYKRIEELMHGAGGALVYAKDLEDWQTADATTFHVLSMAILDLNDRLEKLKAATDKPLVITAY
jgi:hypothetical protein